MEFEAKLKMAVDSALLEPNLYDIAARLAYVSGYVSKDHPEIADLLFKIHSPEFGKMYG